MRLPFIDVHHVLKKTGVDHLYYATTVDRACTLLRSGALVSSTADIHTDMIDGHAATGLPNEGGPVLFVLGLDLIAEHFTEGAWVSKLAQVDWPDTMHSQRWFQTPEELAEAFVLDSSRLIVAFREITEPLIFQHCLRKIVLDDPQRENAQGVPYYHLATAALRRAMFEIHLNAPIENRPSAAGYANATSEEAGSTRLSRLFDVVVREAA